MSDAAAIRILDIAKRKLVPLTDFLWFNKMSSIAIVSEATFHKCLNILKEDGSLQAICIALDLFYTYYNMKPSDNSVTIKQDKKPPADLTYELLTHKSLFSAQKEKKQIRTMDGFYWAAIGKMFVELYPRKSLKFANIILENFKFSSINPWGNFQICLSRHRYWGQ